MKQLVKRPILALLIVLTVSPAAAILARTFPDAPLTALTETDLGGVVAQAPSPKWTLSAFISGDFQKKAMLWVSEAMGRPREIMLRLNNGIGYWMRRSYNSNVIIGRDGFLYPTNYVRDWCAPGRKNVKAEQTAETIAKIRDLVEESGRTFILLLTPTKPSIYPENLDPPCAGNSPKRASVQLREALTKHKITLVDGPRITREARARHEVPLFGRDALHWNNFGASFTVNALMASLEKGLGKPLRKLELANLVVNDRPGPADVDLGEMLNVPFEFRPFPSPHPQFTVDTELGSLRILMLGTSFCWQLLDAIGTNRISENIKFYYYFSKISEFKNGKNQFSDVSFAAEADLPGALNEAEALILEVNEANPFASYIDQFRKALEQLPQKATLRYP